MLAESIAVPAGGLSAAEALALLERGGSVHEELLAAARTARERFLPDREVAFCGILQAKLGGCPEDCAFCCQSARYPTLVGPRPRPLASEEEMVARARRIRDLGGRAFGVVVAGRRLSEAEELDRVARVVERVRGEVGLEPCASLGRVGRAVLVRLASAGLVRYHHNLEAAPSFFPRVVTTYRQEESLETLAAAAEAGLELCSSGVFGLGEGPAERVELIALLRDLGVRSLPLCFLEPREGTPLGDLPLLDPDEALRIVAIHRLMVPTADVIVTGGRDLVLADRGDRVLEAGANGLMVGDGVATFGPEVRRDRALVPAAGCRLRSPRLT